MLLSFEERPCDSPFVEKIWRCHSERAGEFLSVAACHFEIAVTRLQGETYLTLRGPETKATPAECLAEGEWLGIRFQLGSFLPKLTPGQLKDRRDVTLPGAAANSFWLDGSAWEYPNFENADTFVKRLVEKGILARDYAVDAALRGEGKALPVRSGQRHLSRATGLTRSTIRQIQRARHATHLLRNGASILDTVHDAGYFDQAHLTRSLQYRIGQTPAEIARGTRQLSFLYKTTPTP
jgi:hypothetical protein